MAIMPCHPEACVLKTATKALQVATSMTHLL